MVLCLLLRLQYVLTEGSTLEVPITPPPGQLVTATLLQLVSPAIANAFCGGTTASEAVVAANITSAHLQLHPAPTSSSSDAVAAAGRSLLLGCCGTTTIKIGGLAAGLYRLVLPGVMLRPPSPDGYSSNGGVGSQWDQRMESSSMAVHIHVLPAAATAGNSVQTVSAAGDEIGVAAGAAAADDSTDERWLYAGPDHSSIDRVQPTLLQPSLPQQLHITSLTCSVTSGLSLQVAGADQLLGTAQVLLVFSRFLPDQTVQAAELVPPQLPWGTDSAPAGGFGFNLALGSQRQGWGFDSGDKRGLGYGACPQACGASSTCSFSTDTKLDSAVAYVLQRRQWEAAGGGRRPGVLLDRPSLLVFPHSVRSAAVSTSVLKGKGSCSCTATTLACQTMRAGISLALQAYTHVLSRTLPSLSLRLTKHLQSCGLASALLRLGAA
jgi:hypothetical protein